MAKNLSAITRDMRCEFDPWVGKILWRRASSLEWVYSRILSRILVWRIPWTQKPGGLQSIGLHTVGYD